jgi:protein-S-isoprenylcysteine O-methyltransferase Ste14
LVVSPPTNKANLKFQTLFMNTYILLATFWAIYGISHSVFASNWAKNSLDFAKKYYRIIYSVFSLVALFTILFWMALQSKTWLWEIIPLTKGIGLSMATFGLLIVRRVVGQISVSEFVGLKPEMPVPDLIVKGSFEYVRHPIYTGTVLLIWGYFIFSPNDLNLISALCITIYTLIGIQIEEKKLLETFGKPYADYKSKTPMLIPKKFKFFNLLKK